MPGSAVFDTSLVDSIYTDVVDGVRGDLLPAMGIRPFKTFVVARTWSGLTIGDGTFTDAETELNSGTTGSGPRVVEWGGGLTFKQNPCGLLEEGDIRIEEVSLGYTEAEVGYRSFADNEQVMIKLTDAHGQQTSVRYFTHKAPPFPDREKGMGWVLWLTRVNT